MKIGDLVVWHLAPEGGLMLDEARRVAYVRAGGRVFYVSSFVPGGAGLNDGGDWNGGPPLADELRVAALGCTGRETRDEAYRLHRAFECRQSILGLPLDEVLALLPKTGRWAALSLELGAMIHQLAEADWCSGEGLARAAVILARTT